VIDGASLPRHPFAPDAAELAAGVPVLIGATSQEITSLQGFRDPSIFTIEGDTLVARVAAFCAIPAADAEALVAAYRAARAERSPAQIYAAIASDRQFGFAAILLAERQAIHAPVFAYRLEWQSPVAAGRYGAPHNLDLPLIFGRDRAPGITGAGTAHHSLAAAMQTAWGNFARTGNPNHPGLPHWPGFDTGRRATMMFDAACRMVDDPNRLERLAQTALPPRL
jgi:para-nitrobenzyl esterase